MPIPLPFITTLARSGALDRAWAVFCSEGYDTASADPAALAVKGRLLKDFAVRSGEPRRLLLLAEAEAAYAAADALVPQPWLLINVATLAALQGDQARAEAQAHAVLARLEAGNVAETPYFIAAMRAEAHLLCGAQNLAEAAMVEAMAADADSWSDHATTLRQLGRILDIQERDAAWLDAFRPPKSLHFAGHLGISSEVADTLRDEIDTILAEDGIGFGYGALAAGADIVIAEALLGRGAQLHVYLPTQREHFIAQSVAPYGKQWLARFDSCMAEATSVQEATSVSGDYEPLATALAADLAMGAAVLNARLLESKAMQLLIIDQGDGPFGGGASTARDGFTWQTTGNAQRVIVSPRSAPVAASDTKEEGRKDRRLMALLEVRHSGIDLLDEGAFTTALDRTVKPLWANAASLPGQPVLSQPNGNGRLLGFDNVPAAAAFARRLHALDPPGEENALSIAGHYGLIHTIHPGVIGPSLLVVSAIAEAALPGSITVSSSFAAALALSAVASTQLADMGKHGALHLFAI
jgi:hypothetical protein